MKSIPLAARVLALLLVFASHALARPVPYALQEGDVVFTSSRYGQGQAIMHATGSAYTHCGIVCMQGEKLVVLEATQPVRITPLDVFISHGDPGIFTARRLKTPLSPPSYQKAIAWGLRQIGKNYDDQFLWDDERLYCSELVWKIYQEAGINLCEPRLLREYRLDHPEVKKVLIARYGSTEAIPREEKVVAPSDLAASPLLDEVPRK